MQERAESCGQFKKSLLCTYSREVEAGAAHAFDAALLLDHTCSSVGRGHVTTETHLIQKHINKQAPAWNSKTSVVPENACVQLKVQWFVQVKVLTGATPVQHLAF